jgi:glutaminyl-peptide cyclotransferase
VSARRGAFRALPWLTAVSAALALVAGAACAPRTEARAKTDTAPVPTAVARVLAEYPHDTDAFTEGLFIRDGKLFESTGYERRSFIREVDLATGKVLRQVAIPPDQFGEGIVDWGPDIVSVTWQGGIGHRWRIDNLTRIGGFRYEGEGWGLTRNDRHIILSDGTAVLRFLDPVTLKVARRLPVTADGVPVPMLNELEWVDGEILANVWHQDRIARIDPRDGRVKGWIDLSEIAARTPKRDEESVPNGIAWDAKARRLYVTGKYWPTLYRIAWPVD